MNESKNQLLNIVAFAILMENGEGVKDKSPGYILEKFNKYCLNEKDAYLWGLDAPNRLKLAKWAEEWGEELGGDSD
jgi:hypothetical protein